MNKQFQQNFNKAMESAISSQKTIEGLMIATTVAFCVVAGAMAFAIVMEVID